MHSSDFDVDMEEVTPPLETDLDDIEVVSPSRVVLRAEASKEQGNVFYKAKNYTKALQCYSEAIRAKPDEASYYGNRSACYIMLGNYRAALEDATASTKLDPNFLKGYVREAKCWILLGNSVAAEQVLLKAEIVEPGNPAIDSESKNCKLLARCQEEIDKALRKDDHRSVVFWCDRALNIAMGSANIKIRKAESLTKLERFQEAQEIANDILQVDSMNADAIFVRGLCLYYEDQIDKAFQHFQQVLRLAPDHQNAKNTYKVAKALKNTKEQGNAAFRSGDWKSAISLYTQALQIDKCNTVTNSKLYCNRAAVHTKLGNIDDALSDCNKAIELDSNYTKAYIRRAKCCMESEDYEQAVKDYEFIYRKEKTSEMRSLLEQAKLALKKSKRKDYYKILGIDKNSSDDEIKKAYRKRALVHHPDRHASASEAEKKEQEKKFKEVGEAYAVLSDQKKRARYDQGQDLEEMDGYGSGEFNPFNIFQTMFAGGGMPGGFTFSQMGGGGMPENVHSFPGGFTFQFG